MFVFLRIASFAVLLQAFGSTAQTGWREVVLPVTRDATVSSLDPDANYGGNPDLIALTWQANSLEFRLRSLIEFDLTPLEAQREPGERLHAHLVLSPSSGSPHPDHEGFNEALLQRITGGWKAGLVDWNSQPGTTDRHAVFLDRTGPGGEVLEIEVTKLLLDALAGGSTALGLALRLQSETVFKSLNFASSDHADPGLRPRLVVRLEGEGGTAAVAEPDGDPRGAWHAGPNPFVDRFAIEGELDAPSEMRIAVHDASGRLLDENRFALPAGAFRIDRDASGWKPGVYVVRIMTAGHRAVLQLVRIG